MGRVERRSEQAREVQAREQRSATSTQGIAVEKEGQRGRGRLKKSLGLQIRRQRDSAVYCLQARKRPKRCAKIETPSRYRARTY